MFYTQEFELDTVGFLIHQPIYYAQRKTAIGRMKLNDQKLSRLWKVLKDSFTKYNEFPTKTELLERIKGDLQDSETGCLSIEFEEYQDLIESIYDRKTTKNTGEELNKFLADQHRQRIVDQLVAAPVDQLSTVLKEIQVSMNQFRAVHFQDTDLGLNIFSDLGVVRLLKQIDEYQNTSVIPTGWDGVDDTLAGGGRRGEVNCILCPTNGGKTTCLINLAINMVERGHRVVLIYLDSTEQEMANRIGARLLRAPIIPSTDQDLLQQRLKEFRELYPNQLWLKQFPMKSVTAMDINEYLNNLKTYLYAVDKANGVPEDQCGDISAACVDYMEILQVEQRGEAFWITAESGAQELNALAIMQNLLIWTATQGGTEALKAEKITLDMAAGAKSRFHALANVLILCTTKEQKLLPVRKFTFDIAKIRRPARFLSIPMVMDSPCQDVYVDPDLQPTASMISVAQSAVALGRAVEGLDQSRVDGL